MYIPFKLTAGQTVYITIKSNKSFHLHYANPGFSTFEASNGITLATYQSGNVRQSFVATTSGIYFIMLETNNYGIRYEISIQPEGTTVTQVLDDVPGTPLEPGITISSTLDKETKPRDVYSVQLTAGQTVYITIKSNKSFHLHYANPGFSTFDASNGITLATYQSGDVRQSFVAATSGIYFIMLKANNYGIKYEIKVIVK